jgi:ABC-type glycerol-3-phosphate transport system substrate-binding protein
MKRKAISVVFILLALTIALIGASGTTEAVKANAPKPVVTIKFYGADAQYNKNIIAKFEAENPDVKVQIVPVDFDHAEQVIKTGIASGNPVDVSFFWGSQISAFVSSNMAADLTPYLTANNNEWMNTFVQKYIDAGKINGKYYAISYQPVIETLFVNKTIFTDNNLKVPATWDELLKVAEVLKQKGIYAIGNWSGQNHQLLVFAYQIMANNGVLEKGAAGEIPFAGPNELPGLRKTLEMLRDVYKKGYWYPGEGALTATKDQVQAAFYRGQIAMLFDAGSNVGTYQTNAKFNLDVVKFPLVDANSKYAVNVVTNALFVPANAAHKEEAVRFIKFYTSEVGQAETMATGRLPSIKAKQDKIENPLMQALMNTTAGDNVVSYRHLQNISPKISSFLTFDLVSSVCAGVSIDSILAQLEALRLEARK